MTPEQRQDLAGPDPARAIDPDTQDTYVLVRESVFFPCLAVEEEGGPWETAMHLVLPIGGWGRLARWLVLVGLVASGCSSGSGLTQVTGTVTYEGVPLTNGSISFVSDSGGANAAGIINERGEYTLSTHRPGDGVAPGTYRVCISSFETPPGMTPQSGKRAIPERYFDVRHSGLTATVENRRSQVIDFPLRSD